MKSRLSHHVRSWNFRNPLSGKWKSCISHHAGNRKLQRPPCKRKTLLTHFQVTLGRRAMVRERLPVRHKGRTQKHFPMASKQDLEKTVQDVFPENKWTCLWIWGPWKWATGKMRHMYSLYFITTNLQMPVLEPKFSIFPVHAKDTSIPVEGGGRKGADLLQDSQSFSLEQSLHITKWSWAPPQRPRSLSVPMELRLGL